MEKYVEFSELKGKILSKVETFSHNHESHNDAIRFLVSDFEYYELRHEQDCCEDVDIESIVGDLSTLVGYQILLAEEVTQPDENADESGTWTFYKLGTIKGYVDIRFYGASNGYYSEEVSLVLVNKGQQNL